ncbi:CIC family chloride channel protein [Endobacter medicaginis]|uniref:CIC family chloride channel protein n=2 Tax=Endobacter medicaginis TaxID=1181271 RepID=A0A839UTD3_9PROT|nr:chloride channel protein [Endobacter medicaginis]MBB3173508.1 CIC family chloride channel protein [Endobacter medicaginis]MCX5475403.1 chloride channel protein [Endobacter medicaginis]
MQEADEKIRPEQAAGDDERGVVDLGGPAPSLDSQMRSAQANDLGLGHAQTARLRHALRTPAAVGSAVADRIVHAPQTLRALVRTDELWFVALAAILGSLCGLMVVAINDATTLMHRVLFDVDPDGRLSGLDWIEPARALLVPTLGGLALGGTGLLLARLAPGRPIDPIEANALYGGRMSLRDSIVVVIQTVMSNGVGASVGLEAAYTQIGSAIGSRIGRSFRVRRGDLRLLVGCGAAGAIAAAFDAPLAGAFYAFELVIGTYTLAALAPVVAAACCAILVTHLIGGNSISLDVPVTVSMGGLDYLSVVALGVVSALAGVALMRGVTLTESIFRGSRVPGWLRPGIGGLCVGGLALVTPAVLSSGHAALRLALNMQFGLQQAALILLLKALASSISIGTGFRGGLFFASLLLGTLTGDLFGETLSFITSQTLPLTVYAVIGMSAFAVAVVGGPFTMGFLALESTGSLPLTMAVMVASVVSALTVRRTFGYSFATWRFHLRGESIRSAVDVGWMRSLTVGRMMRRDVRTTRIDTPIAAVRRAFPLGAAERVVVVDAQSRYLGQVAVAELHAARDAAAEARGLSGLLHDANAMLRPQMSVKEAIAAFERSESDALVVVEDTERRQVIGILSEQYALRRYTEELENRRRELSGEG